MTAAASQPAAAPEPVRPKDRIYNLDMLRGWAILGILAVNAIAFAWPSELTMAEAPPPLPMDRADLIGLWVVDVFFSDKMRTLFTMLFGVSVFLVGGERKDRDKGRVLWRRLIWLAVIGALHGALLWYGDILLHYAYSGMILMAMRSWRASRLLWVGGGVTLLWGLIATLGYWGMANLPPEMGAQMRAGMPAATPEVIAATVEIYRSGWPAGFMENLQTWAMFQLMASPFLTLVTVPLMMLGLGLFKSGYLSGRAPLWTYVAVILVGGANLAAFAVWRWQDLMAGEADPTNGLAAAAGGTAFLITLFYASVLILLVRFGGRLITAWLAPVGRMAFTNYLTQTLIMVTLYYAPWGPMWFGTHDPVQMWTVVGAVWALQLIWSPLWLSVFQMGPLEWAWRCLSYGRMVPIRKAAA